MAQTIDPLSLTWIYLRTTLRGDREVFASRLTAQGVDERDADFLRGQIDYIDQILSLSDQAEADYPTP